MVEARRRLLYAECALVYFALGLFLTLPLQLAQSGHDAVFFARVYAAGAVGAIACVAGSAQLIARYGLARVTPWGGAMFAVGSLLFAASVEGGGLARYMLASAVQGIGWGLYFTLGPVALSSLSTSADRTRHFALYGAYGSLGVGAAPLVADYATTHGVSFAALYLLAALLGIAASLLSHRAARAGYTTPAQNGGLRFATIRSLLRGPAPHFYLLVALAACIYTSMMNFQTLYAGDSGLSYSVFYACYTLAVVASRFMLAGVAGASPGRALFLLL
ncbi:MAG TPA: MFS transporter, partial [Burkholderiaceae bacterium]